MDWTGEREHNPKTWPKGGRAKAPSPTKAKACILPAAPWIFIFTNAKGEYLCSNIWFCVYPGVYRAYCFAFFLCGNFLWADSAYSAADWVSEYCHCGSGCAAAADGALRGAFVRGLCF